MHDRSHLSVHGNNMARIEARPIRIDIAPSGCLWQYLVRRVVVNHGGNEMMHGLLAELNKHGDGLPRGGAGDGTESGGPWRGAGLE